MYQIGTYITDPIGNNEFHYDERIALGSEIKIFVPSLIQGSVNDLEEGSETVFEEVENGKLISCTGLKHFIQTSFFAKEGDRRSDDSKGIPVYIFDNHNHALTFRSQYHFNIGTFEHLSVIHIDQHADTKPNNNTCPPSVSLLQREVAKPEGFKEGVPFRVEDLENFVNTKTNVGNFISAALNNGIIDEVIQIRTDYTLQQLGAGNFKLGANFILDIDIDFRADKEVTPEDIKIIRKIIQQAKLVTIATSPYFIDQKRAIEIIKQLLK